MASACGLLRAASAARPFAPSSSSARCRAALSSSRRRRRRAARVVDVSARAVIDVENDDEEERFPPPPPPSLGPGPLPLLDPTKGYTHVSPGVCDACANDVDARIAWVALLLGQLPSHRANATRTRDMLVGEGKLEDAETFMDRYALWERDYEAYLASVSLDDKAPGEGATLLDMVREKERLLRARGFDDLFAGMKAEENEIATALYRPIGLEIDDIWEPTPGAWYGPGEHPDPNAKANMIRAVIECCLAGNLFDAGSASAVQRIMFCEDGDPDDPDDAAEECKYVLDADALAETFAKARERVSHEKSGGWRFDSLSRVVERCTREKDVEKKIAPGWRRVLIFCDNAGADVMGMTMLAKALAAVGGKGTKVALVANDTAALNDVTYEELDEYLRAVTRRGGEFYDGDPILGAQMNGNMVAAVNSGQDSTLLNLNNCGSELNDWVNMQFQQVPAGDDWLIVLDGMGRSLESNWDAYKYVKDGVNVLNLAMVKSEINARRLDAEVYDCVVRLRRGGDPE